MSITARIVPQPTAGRPRASAGHPPGPRFKEMLAAVDDAQLEGAIASKDEAMKLLREKFPMETSQ